MIGSASRDFLLHREIKDYDFVTDATPDESLKFINADTHFKKYGVLKLKVMGVTIDLATLREESDYLDYRHPSYIKFVNDINTDYKRRDFTINAIYINENYEIEEISKKGYQDLLNRRLVFIGDTLKRIKEDPLRILRAYRFKKEYNLVADDETMRTLKENYSLIESLNKKKVEEEYEKFKSIKENDDVKQ